MIYEFGGIKPKIAKSAFLVPSADVIGDVTIGENSSVWFNVTIRGDVNTIKIGKNTNIQDNTCIHVTHKFASTTLGDNITVGHSVTLHGCEIKDGALIGMGATVLDKAVVGEEAFVAAGAVITPNTVIPPRVLVVGSPAKVKRELKPEELEYMRGNAKQYVDTFMEYRKSGFPESLK